MSKRYKTNCGFSKEDKLEQVMTKKTLSKLEEARAAWEDTVTEDEVIMKLGLSQELLRKMRREGKIKNFCYAAPSSTGNKARPGRKPIYSMIELVELFSPSAKTA